MNDKMKLLAKGRTGKILMEILEEVKQKIADIRTPIKVKAEIENQVRLGVIEVLDDFLVNRLKVMSGDMTPPDPDEHI